MTDPSPDVEPAPVKVCSLCRAPIVPECRCPIVIEIDDMVVIL